jgi:hypothetical protein
MGIQELLVLHAGIPVRRTLDPHGLGGAARGANDLNVIFGALHPCRIGLLGIITEPCKGLDARPRDPLPVGDLPRHPCASSKGTGHNGFVALLLRAVISAWMDSSKASRLAATVLVLLGLGGAAQSQPLGANPSAAPSDIGNPSSINPSARPSDIGNPSAINPSAAASQLSPSAAPGRPMNVPRSQRLRPAPIQGEVEQDDVRKQRSAKAPPAEEAPTCKAGKAKVGNWQALREHLAACWTIPAGTEGSSVTLRFGISAAGELRGSPLITATDVKPKEMTAAYRKAATAVLEQCLPVCPTEDFGSVMGESTMHLRLVNAAPLPSRNLGPWMTIFAKPR